MIEKLFFGRFGPNSEISTVGRSLQAINVFEFSCPIILNSIESYFEFSRLISSNYLSGLQSIDEPFKADEKINFPKYSEESRPSMIENESDFDDLEEQKSMSIEEAQKRLIDPENIVIGGKMSASMFDFVPSKSTKNWGDDFVEESDYYTKYQELKQALPFDIYQAGVYEYPEKLNAFIHPYGVFDHFSAPKRPYGKITVDLFVAC